MGDEKVLNMEDGKSAFVQRATDPVVSNVATPTDFAAQFPNPLDTTEIIAMCEEINVWKTIPDVSTGLKTYTWRELNELEFVSGTHYIGFTDGACPEEYDHDGDNFSVNLKNIGVKKSLTISDILHSAASIAAGGAISRIVGGASSSEGMPGGMDSASFLQDTITDLKEKEVILGMILTLNGWDRLLVAGDATTYPLEFDGIEHWASNRQCTFNTNSNTASGTFSAASYDRFLVEGCAKPTHIYGHPAAIQEVMSAYFQLGAATPQQVINYGSGNRIVPGFNFAGFVNTAVGMLTVIADSNFARLDAGGGVFQSTLYSLRMTHNGEPLVYKITQIPLAFKDLAPGCTAISFEIWAKTALVVKNCCAHSAYTSQFTGRITTTCPVIG